MTTEKFEIWAILELFGHQKMAGKISEQQVAGANMVRIDVPNTPDIPPFTRFIHPNAIYAINPVDEKVATAMAGKIQSRPIDTWDIDEVLRRINDTKQLHSMSGQDI